MADAPIAAALFYDALVDVRRQAERTARQAWADMAPAYLSESWTRLRPPILAALVAAQVEAASMGATYGAFALAEQGMWQAPDGFVNPQAFGGWSSSGAKLGGTLDTALVATKEAIGGGAGTVQALAHGWETLSGIVRMQVSDAGRVAAGIDVAARPGVGYVRMLNPPSCPKCVVLAGKFYRWNAGFRRHPRCDCVHVTSTAGSTEAAHREGLVDDPYEYFHSLDQNAQDRAFGAANAQAIRDGGDIYQVVNSARGRKGAFTTEGTGRRGYASSILKARQRRMTPETIYRLHGDDRAGALADLRAQGYILPGGQVSGGSLRGRVEGHGQMGRGGTRKAASEALAAARRTGVRDPSNRYTMTAAERRVYDAKQKYLAVLDGHNPQTSPGFSNTPDPTGLLRGYGRSSADGTRGRPVTPLMAAQYEAAYRRLLASGGQTH
ncbi:MAG: hypothetical protein FWF90_11440 [Promicromonosporaceae bacterium]|nr:hypothetical protein [Promicromonosporaceae bacterium]